jgi:hypothetical protein
VKPKHQIHVLHRLPGGAFDQIVLAGNDNQALAVLRQAKADVAIIRVQRNWKLTIAIFTKASVSCAYSGRPSFRRFSSR